MNFKRTITIVLLGILALLMIRSVQAADVVAQGAKAVTETAVTEPGFFASLASTLGGYATSVVDYAEGKSSITINPVTVTRRTLSFVKDHPWIIIGTTIASVYGYSKYATWYNRHASLLSQLNKLIAQDLGHQGTRNQKQVTNIANEYRTPYGFKHARLITNVNSFYNGNTKFSNDVYTTIKNICENKIESLL